MRNSDDFSPAVIDRAAVLLEEFRDGGDLTLSQLSNRTGLPRSSAHRLLSQLVELGWVERHGQTYTLGRSLFEWGALARRRSGLQEIAHPFLNELYATTGLVVHLGVLEGNDVRILDKVGYGPIALPTRIGGLQPARRTALGKALLAFCDNGSARRRPTVEVLASAAEEARRRSEMAVVRQRRTAYERDEAALGVACVAAPIGDLRSCAGAIAVTGPAETVDGALLATPVRATANAIWQALSDNGSVRRAG
ncbi:IclR family transcriptional regulator [Gordonia rubripertincta]|uniref:IclR family transcriptional regulator n=1 Tax=Gordonia rubripertincta TaxID=36822 RepID=UPI0015FB2B67|nr:IclR family transcriptional regulator [Gordonia rubripertincta]QMU23092.1 IclR family transcriptional regulator [Gordonia rubripertincta]